MGKKELADLTLHLHAETDKALLLSQDGNEKMATEVHV